MGSWYVVAREGEPDILASVRPRERTCEICYDGRRRQEQASPRRRGAEGGSRTLPDMSEQPPAPHVERTSPWLMI
jgi:hypothetical protein